MIAAVIAIIYGFLVMIVGHVVITDISSLADNVIAAVTNYEQSIKSWISNNIGSNIVSDKFTDFTGYLMTWLSDNVSATSVITFFTGIGGNVVDVVVGIIISIYLMKDKNFFLGLWREIPPPHSPSKGNAVLTETLGEINIVLSKFIRGALLDSLFVAILASIGLSVLGLEAAVFIGVFAGIANIIPYFGPVLGMIPAFLMGIYTGGFWHGAIAVIILLVVQQIDSNIIYPKVVGTSTGLHPLMVLLAVSVFGYFGGILGMLPCCSHRRYHTDLRRKMGQQQRNKNEKTKEKTPPRYHTTVLKLQILKISRIVPKPNNRPAAPKLIIIFPRLFYGSGNSISCARMESTRYYIIRGKFVFAYYSGKGVGCRGFHFFSYSLCSLAARAPLNSPGNMSTLFI